MEPDRYFDGNALSLAQAIKDNRLTDVVRIAKEVEINRFYQEDMTLLIWAMLVDRPEAFELLLTLGANPNLKDKDNIQPVAIAAGAKDDNKYLKILLQHGGDPNSTQRTRPAIHVAFGREYYKNLDILLGAKADINSRDEHDDTILIKAGYQEKFDTAIDLINRGADIHLTSAGGGIALEVQQSMTKVGSKTYQDQAKLRQLLLEKGIKFPIFHPSYIPYTALLEQWHKTAEGKVWQEKLAAIGARPDGFGSVWVENDRAAFAAFKAWMAANQIPMPDKPKPKRISLN